MKNVYHVGSGELTFDIIERIVNENLKLELAPEAHDWLLQRGFLPEYGAREMDRVIASHLKPLLMREILFGKLKSGGKACVQVEQSRLQLQISAR